jgi:hypothetical protein
MGREEMGEDGQRRGELKDEFFMDIYARSNSISWFPHY